MLSNRSSLSFASPRPIFTRTSLHNSQFVPTLTLESPMMIKISWDGVVSIWRWRWSYNLMISSSDEAVVGAYTWKIVVAPICVRNLTEWFFLKLGYSQLSISELFYSELLQRLHDRLSHFLSKEKKGNHLYVVHLSRTYPSLLDSRGSNPSAIWILHHCLRFLPSLTSVGRRTLTSLPAAWYH